MKLTDLIEKLKTENNGAWAVLENYLTEMKENPYQRVKEERYDATNGYLWGLSAADYITKEERKEMQNELLDILYPIAKNMKTIYYIRTNGYDMVVAVDTENQCRYLTETDGFPYMAELDEKEKKEKAIAFLKSIEDDSSWEEDCTYQQIFKESSIEIIAEIRKEP